MNLLNVILVYSQCRCLTLIFPYFPFYIHPKGARDQNLLVTFFLGQKVGNLKLLRNFPDKREHAVFFFCY